MGSRNLNVSIEALDDWLHDKFHPEDDRLVEHAWSEIKDDIDRHTRLLNATCHWFDEDDEDGEPRWVTSCGHYMYQLESEDYRCCPYCSYDIARHMFHHGDEDAWIKHHEH